jgi:hypothetical protein
MKNVHQVKITDNVARWMAERHWVDLGRWGRGNRGSKEYHPTRAEIRAKCKLFRTTPYRHGAHARAPRGGEFAIPSLSSAVSF